MTDRPIVTTRREDSALVVTFEVERMNEFQMADTLNKALKRALADETFERLVLDFSKVQYVISEIFCVLIQLAKEIEQRNKRVVACALNPFLREIYTTIRLDSQIPVCNTLEEALKA